MAVTMRAVDGRGWNMTLAAVALLLVACSARGQGSFPEQPQEVVLEWPYLASHTGDIAVSGEWMAVGMPSATSFDPPAFSCGAVLMLRRVGDAWQPWQLLFADEPDSWSHFGVSLDLEGELLAVGSPWFAYEAGDNTSGAVSVFRVNEQDQWVLEATILPPPSVGESADNFGDTVAIGPDTLVVGSYYGDLVCVFENRGSQWPLTQTFSSPVGYFGFSVDLDGDTLVIGDPFGYNGELDSAHIIERRDGSWQYSGSLFMPGLSEHAHFGYSVAIDADTIIVGAPCQSTDAGSVHLFVRTGGYWLLQQSLQEPAAPPPYYEEGGFGTSVALSGNFAVIGRPYLDVQSEHGVGAVYTVTRSGTQWSELREHMLENADGHGSFGYRVTADASRFLATSYSPETSLIQGSVWNFASPDCPLPCPGDATGDGSINFADLNLVIARWQEPSTPGANGDIAPEGSPDGIVNFADLNAVISAFGAACN